MRDDMMPTKSSVGDSLDWDGWHVEGTTAEYWGDEDHAQLTLYVPKDVTLTPNIKAMLQTAYKAGQDRGELRGSERAKHAVRRALGL